MIRTTAVVIGAGHAGLAMAFNGPIDPQVLFEIWTLRSGLPSGDVSRSSGPFVGSWARSWLGPVA
jgi:hypothetical protein